MPSTMIEIGHVWSPNIDALASVWDAQARGWAARGCPGVRRPMHAVRCDLQEKGSATPVDIAGREQILIGPVENQPDVPVTVRLALHCQDLASRLLAAHQYLKAVGVEDTGQRVCIATPADCRGR
jgi:hypothetical protein